jgi:hypothetical protein
MHSPGCRWSGLKPVLHDTTMNMTTVDEYPTAQANQVLDQLIRMVESRHSDEAGCGFRQWPAYAQIGLTE